MAKINLGLRHGDVDTTQREGTGGALPDGYYRFEVDEMQPKDHFDNRPGYKLDTVLEVIEPEEFKGRKIFLDFGVEDPTKEEFEGWGREALGRFLRAIDFPADQPFDDTDDVIGKSGIAKVGLDRKRSDKQNKRFSKLWGYVYPGDERDWLADNDLGASAKQEDWFPGKQTPVDERRGGDRDRDRGGRDERGSRERDERSRGNDRGNDRGREDRSSRDDRGGRDNRDSDRERGRDRDEGRGRDRDERLDSRGDEGDDIPFDGNREGGDERPQRGGGSNPWNRGGSGGRR